LYVFVSFWTAFFPNKKRLIYLLTTLLFIIWKSPYSQTFIDLFSQNIYIIQRVVDYSDLLALFILPFAYFYTTTRKTFRLKLNPVPIALLTVFSFCATSIPKPRQIFEQPQYILLTANAIDFQETEYPNCFVEYEIDSMLIVSVKEIRIEKRAPIDDEYHKVQVLKDLDLRLLRESNTENYNKEFSDFVKLRDSIMVFEETSITLNLDTVTDILNFKKSRLDGKFERFSQKNQLLITGKYKNGIEDSTWSYYERNGGLLLKKHFENGELVKTETFKDSKLVLKKKHNTRAETIKNKYFHTAIIFVLICGILYWLILQHKQPKDKGFVDWPKLLKIICVIGLPIIIFVLAKVISTLIPYSYSNFFLGIFAEALLVYIVSGILLVLVLFKIKLRSNFDILFYILLFSLSLVLIEEIIYLKDII
jgi:uncharacterized membrane protein YhdT